MIKFVFCLFIHLCLFSLSLYIEHSNLYFTSYSYSKSIYIYICIDKRRADPKGYSPAVFYSLDLRYWCLIRILSRNNGTCLNTYENNYERNKEKKREKERRILWIEKMMIIRLVDRHHCLFITLFLYHWQ